MTGIDASVRPAAILSHRPDGTMRVRSTTPLGSYPAKLTERLVHWAAIRPDGVLAAQRGADGRWVQLTFAAALSRIRRLGQGLLGSGLSVERPLAILSGNDLDHLLLTLACFYVGVPVSPVSPSYALVSTDFAKLRHVLGLLTPGAVFVADGAAFAPAIAAAVPDDAALIVRQYPPAGRSAIDLATLEGGATTADADAAHAAVDPSTIAKILFTSGSTGMPKGVINTQRMLTSNQAMIEAAMPQLAIEPPVLVDWLPWNHTFGGNKNVGIAVYHGGTLYLDGGRPVPGAIEETVHNLREIAPTVYFNVPAGYEALLPYLRREPELRHRFFARNRCLFYAGAGMSRHVWDELEALSLQATGEVVPIVTGLGSTETAPMSINATGRMAGPGMIGLPVPGVQLKLVPVGDKLEVRFKGPNVFPGYWRQPELTRAAFDEDGFYRMGDAIRFVDPARIEQGFRFDGRIAEDFKLSSGTWVSVGPLRTQLIAAMAPLARDVVVTGHDRRDLAVLIFPILDACRALCPEAPPGMAAAEILAHPAVRAAFQGHLRALAGEATGSATRVERAILLAEPPSLDRGELTDKGSINQRMVLTHRADLVTTLYERPLAPEVVSAHGEDLP